MNSPPKKDALIKDVRDLLKNGMIRTVLLLVLVLVANFVLQAALVLILKTNRPLHTPISGSMEPTLKVGDLLIVQGGLNGNDVVAGAKPVGDVVVFKKPGSPDEYVVHRVVNKSREAGTWYFVTQGDANTHNDWELWRWKIPEGDVVGKVMVSIPVLGYALRLLDETKIYIGAYSITLRMALIISLIAVFFLLEFMGSSEAAKKPTSIEEPGKARTSDG